MTAEAQVGQAFCGCGCQQAVKHNGSRFVRGHNSRIAGSRLREISSQLKTVLHCRSCGWSWRRATERTTESCPRCNKITGCRIRKLIRSGFTNRANFKRKSAKEIYSAFRKRVLLIVGDGVVKCAWCGCDNPALLEVNHKSGGGAKEIRECGGSTKLYWKIINRTRPIDDLNPLCKVCNAVHALELKHGKLPFVVSYLTAEVAL